MHIMKTKRKYTVILTVLYILEASFMMTIPFFSSSLVDNAQDKNEDGIILYSVLMASAVLFCILFKTLAYFLYSSFSLKEEKRLKDLLFLEISQKPLSVLSSYKSAEIELLYTKDLSHLLSNGLDVIPTFIRLFVRLFMAVGLLIYFDWKFLVVVICFGILGFFMAKLYSKIMKPRHKAHLSSQGKANGFLVEEAEGFKLIKAYEGELNAKEYYDKLLDDEIRAERKRNDFLYSGNSVLYAISAIVYIGPLIYGAFGIYHGWFTYGVLLALSELVSQVVNPFLSISSLLNQYNLGKASEDRLNKILSMEKEEKKDVTSDFDEIVFDDVSFSYDGVTDCISHLSLSIKKKDTVLFSGPSGIGKTTVFMLLMGFITPSSGHIYVVNGNHKHEISHDDIGLFSYVPQENILFSGTIKDNLKILTGADDDKMMASLKVANVYDEIMNLKDGLDTHLDGGGKGLSLGQIQRILIAASILRNKEILLLDEFSSALDKDNEKIIMENLKNLDKTIIYITHRTNLYPMGKCVNLENKD